MHEIITLQHDYNENIERKNQTLVIKLRLKKYFKEWKKLVIFNLVLFFLGFYPIKNFDSNLIYYLFRFGAIYLLIYWIIIWRSYVKAKKAFKIKLNQMIRELSTADKN